MPSVRLDLRRLEPGQAPRPEDVAAAADAGSVAVRGPVPALAAVLTVLLKAERSATVPVAWEPAGDKDSLALARDIGVGTGEQRELGLVRDDHGGVLLHHGRIEAAGDGRRSLSRRLGLQAHHDDIKVADGEITRIDVRPDWRAVDTIGVTVMLQPLRPDPADQRPGPPGGLGPRPDRARRRRRTPARSPAGPGTPTTGCGGCSQP